MCGQAGLTILRESGSRYGEAIILGTLGAAYEGLGDREAALACYRQALTINQELGDRYGLAESLRDLGASLWELGDRQQARANWQQALVIFQELQVPQADDVRAMLAAGPATDGLDAAVGADESSPGP